MAILSLNDLSIKGKKVLVRVDFNVPQDLKGQITDASRIKASLPTLRHLLDEECSIILMSHLGRPKGEDSLYSLKPVLPVLSELLGREVLFANDCGGPDSIQKAKNLKPGQILLLENLRFNPGEEKPEKDENFAKRLASLADCYIDDAFGAAHRSHCSITEVPKYFEGKKGAGLLLEKEHMFLQKITADPARPFIAIIGGAKISSKIGVIKTLSQKADHVLMGGAMAFTLLKQLGYSIGDSLIEEDTQVEIPKNLILPIDFVAIKGKEVKIFSKEIPEGWKGMDIGPETIKLFTPYIEKAKTILWNGPVGVFEDERFASGTNSIAQLIALSKGITIVGGGDSLAAVHKLGLENSFSHISTGGGATLEYLEQGSLPGLDALKK